MILIILSRRLSVDDVVGSTTDVHFRHVVGERHVDEAGRRVDAQRDARHDARRGVGHGDAVEARHGVVAGRVAGRVALLGERDAVATGGGVRPEAPEDDDGDDEGGDRHDAQPDGDAVHVVVEAAVGGDDTVLLGVDTQSDVRRVPVLDQACGRERGQWA